MREVLRGIAKVAVGLVLLTIGNIAFFIGYLMQKSPLMIIPLAIAAVCYVAIWYLCETCEEEKTLTMKENYKNATHKKTVVFDFDGVIHSYTSGWQGIAEIPDPPVEGIKEAIEEIRAAGFEVVVVSTRSKDPIGSRAVKEYLKRHEIEVDGIMATKPPAIVYVDDRAICFDGNAGALLWRIKNFCPWYQKPGES